MHPALTRSFRINYFDVIFIVIYWLSITCIYLIDYKGVIVVLWATPKEAMSIENRYQSAIGSASCVPGTHQTRCTVTKGLNRVPLEAREQ